MKTVWKCSCGKTKVGRNPKYSDKVYVKGSGYLSGTRHSDQSVLCAGCGGAWVWVPLTAVIKEGYTSLAICPHTTIQTCQDTLHTVVMGKGHLHGSPVSGVRCTECGIIHRHVPELEFVRTERRM